VAVSRSNTEWKWEGPAQERLRTTRLVLLVMQAGGPQLQEARQSLPPEGLDGEPGDGGVVYVNVRQHHAILRRRRQRAKAEAENKALRVRKVTHFFFTVHCSMDQRSTRRPPPMSPSSSKELLSNFMV